ncbi:hypothetical protein PMI07_002057 [Rhizobium sp. CF080]|uniref:hypothetical protein n=1 Tax=Rhizobium sp. (strain CF080) TaxID=1144310 RepID=UPI000271CE0B|nr:hypothetical protein [Rhizobium sp. CF080]EUB95569.1 hypothetical protein PMI07_002057 [Rhizobium sp. CF080]
MAAKSNTTKPSGGNRGSRDQLNVAKSIATMMAANVDAAAAAIPAASYTGHSPEYGVAWQKCRDLGKQLSLALAETGDQEFAFIQPAGNDFAVGFGQLNSDTTRLIEYPVETVDRLSTRLALALDDWSEYTTWKSAAHVYPASTGRGVWYRNIDTIDGRADAKSLADLVDRHRKALAAWDAVEHTVPDDPIEIEMVASRKALIDFRPASMIGMHLKADAMLMFRSIFEWDELDRAEIIRAFTDGKEVLP